MAGIPPQPMMMPNMMPPHMMAQFAPMPPHMNMMGMGFMPPGMMPGMMPPQPHQMLGAPPRPLFPAAASTASQHHLAQSQSKPTFPAYR